MTFPVPAHRRRQAIEARCYQCNGPLGPQTIRVIEKTGPCDLCSPKCLRAHDAGEALSPGARILTAADLDLGTDPAEESAALRDWMR